ncbi:type B 50S ribosomal protein L31 [Aeriscardovia aeriphila]|uniref:Large ribosomal subunit protein bL31B n=1 Tax=Aeriscardovia aeriphila TaxID=218139 RepID=A0A261FD76_9BIFI|nr:type B 50S ribosomal protein L31 [Aeriscardovia aeriphila]MDO5695070.1 type B 50S ribosomal protein L31 [Aeriscardovia aeriphila]NYI26290.1 large subunit ribosomal protein L31 [Aeriscardovia aeriphila]OZG56836.1 50S ribosomal protein L31 [Aeriscardovia aeriphila]HJF18139.1 type B 50S ribosomal protein L31 [Aeriscardovia aeriphila]
MKQDIHPEYGPVVFRDRTGNLTFMTKSTLVNDPRYTETITWEDGNEYKLIDVDTSSASHPFYTGKRTVLDTAGQVSKFEARYGKRKKN